MKVLSDEVMRKLSTPYGDAPAERDHGFDRALGIFVPAVNALVAAIDSDMDVTVHGVRWWVGHPIGDKRRILISDHLIESVRSIEKNLVDAKLHELSLAHFDAREAHQMRHLVTVQRGQIKMEFPKRETPIDDLSRTMGDLHRVGFFRAVGSALDCLGAACVGVLGVPIDLLKSDLGGLRAWLKKQQQNPSPSVDGPFFRGFAANLEATISAAGPPDWLDWTLDMRNMQVHRARRFQLATVHPRPTGAATASGDPEVISDVALHLPKSPAHSDIEVMVATTYQPLLSEDSAATISGVLRSTVEVLATTCTALTRAWEFRRTAPNLVMQPLKQWANTPAKPVSQFPGYAPGTRSVAHDQLLGNPRIIRRMQVAALSDADHEKWNTFS
ncbi:MAG: hypothetical protein JO257_15730 [Deltaproteobacteria bacterium]|nr:hypothetical protein [Deltaproteobacteria bacterium]